MEEDHNIFIEKQSINYDKLNQTRMSSNIHCNSNQTSVINNSSNNAPFHSYFMFRNNGQNNNNKPDLRLLNFNGRSTSSTQIQTSFRDNQVKKKIGFGCSQQRKVDIFQGKRQCLTQQRQTCNQQLSSILFKTYMKSQKQEKTVQKTSPIKQSTNLKKQNKKIIAFGIGSSVDRNHIPPFRQFNPGPAYYKIQNNCQLKDKLKNQKKLLRNYVLNKNNSNGQNLKDNTYLQLGPGSYTLPSFNSQNLQILQKFKRKQKFKNKKLKAKMLLQKLHQDRKKMLESFDKFKSKTMNKSKDNKDYVKNQTNNYQIKKESQKKTFLSDNSHHKLLRNQLRDKTNNFLPKFKQDLFIDKFHGATHQHMFSNSFVLKNDHAYQAHYYKPRQQQPQYFFIKGKQNIRQAQESSFFKSKLNRQLF